MCVVCVLCLQVFTSLCVRIYFPVFAYVSQIPLQCQQASGPLVNMMEFMDQQTLHPTLSEIFVIGLNHYFDTRRTNT